MILKLSYVLPLQRCKRTVPQSINEITCEPGQRMISERTNTLVDLLRSRSFEQSHRPAYTFLHDGESEEIDLTYADLDEQARSIAAQLQAAGMAGERVLLLYPPGLSYIAAFLGCLYAGAVAVPVYSPRANRTLLRLQAIMEDAQAKMALTTHAVF